MLQKSGNVIISINVQTTLQDGLKFHSSIRSKYFLDKYIMEVPLPSSVRTSALEEYTIEDILYKSINIVITYINNKCKFRVIG